MSASAGALIFTIGSVVNAELAQRPLEELVRVGIRPRLDRLWPLVDRRVLGALWSLRALPANRLLVAVELDRVAFGVDGVKRVIDARVQLGGYFTNLDLVLAQERNRVP